MSGRVTIDGQPLSAGKVMFAPRAESDSIESGRPAFGRLQEDGTFKLSTFKDDDGAVVGSHFVTIFGPGNKEADRSPGIPPFGRMAVRGEALSVEADAENHFDINLTLKEIKRYSRAYE